MEFEDTSGSKHEPSLLDTEAVRPADGGGIETRRQRARISAALFDETPTPIKIGRFTIVRELGAGGMGVVYVAYDEQLDRRVAVKLLRGSDSDVEAKLRLRREAQAMARLQHPNVVAVHEVGDFQDQVFVAMEFVEGQDLRAWLKSERRPWRSVVAIFAQAGEGLAAAHDAGIVHRDFKPDNVLVGQDGRVRVADFGLAHALDATTLDGAEIEPTDAPPVALDTEQSGRLDSSLTKTGAIMGTPAYMAPEQFEGTRTDARSDQFCFCVALWEGLYGCRPFSGANLAALSYAVMAGEIDAPPANAEVPAWLHSLLVRGLSPMAEDRWPSMRTLLDALAKDPEVRRKRALRVSVLASVTATLVGGLIWLAGTSVAQNARQSYWNDLTEQLLEIERERGFRQASDDAQRARDATRMSVYRSYRPKGGVVDHEDPTVAAVLLREVEGSARESEAWVSAANEILGRPISRAVLTGHRDLAAALAFTPDGQILYSGSADGTVRRWDLSTGSGEIIITNGKDVTELVVSSNGNFVASSAKDGTVRGWWAETRESRVIVEHDDEVMSIALSADGRQLVTASKDGTAKVVDLTSASAPVVLRGHEGRVYGAMFDATGRRVLTVSADHRARLWRADDGACLAVLEGHHAPVFHGRFVDEHQAITASDDGDVRLWQLAEAGLTNSEVIVHHEGAVTALDVRGSRALSSAEDGSVQVTSLVGRRSSIPLKSHADGVWSAKFTPKGDRVVTASFDATARVMDAEGDGVPMIFTGHRIALVGLAIDPAERWLATGSYDGSIRIWDLQRPRLEMSLEGHDRTVFAVDIDEPGQRVLTASRDGTARLWDVASGTALKTFVSESDSLNAAVFSPDGQHLATATKSGKIGLWDIDSGSNESLFGHEGAVWAVAFDEDGDQLASASYDGTARIWDVDSATDVRVFVGHEDKVIDVDFEPGGRRLVTASHDGTLRFWDVRTGAPEAVLAGHEGRIWKLVRSPDHETLATASEDGTARVWPDDVSEHAIVLRGHEKTVWSMAFDDDGERLVTASFDGTARIWDVSDGSLLATLAGHAAGLWDAQFIGDDRVVTISDDNTVRVWLIDGSEPPIVLSGHADGIASLAVSRDGTRVISGSGDTTAKIWRVDLLTSNVATLYQRLVGVTTYCLTVDQRVRELGNDVRDAELAIAQCEGRLD